ncbi:hypothetical protein [Demequina phytophila]|uniref:hypothetical protein n=1 Tax=Demequina phytophila TaxID=1638981 RepID=UPI000785E98E|nr:hypothetical protein [Demequina phytophila]
MTRPDALSAFWRQYRHRQSGTGAGGVVYAIYVTSLAVLIYGGPAVRRLGSALHSPDVVTSLVEPATVTSLAGVLGAVLVASFTIGTTRGPAVMRPFVVHALVTSDIPRRRVFARPMLRATLAVIALSVLLAAVLLVPLADADAMSWGALGAGLVAAALYGLVLVVVWLAGQAATGIATWVVPTALVVAIGAGLAWPALGRLLPWTWAASTWPDGSSTAPLLPLAGLAVLAVAAVAAVPRLLGGLSGPPLIEQARRWEGATIAATTGDLTTAMGSFRATPSLGRRWRVVRGASFALAVVRADLAATLRMPLRALVAVLALGGGGWVLAAAPDAPGLLRWALACASSLLIFTGLGPLSDGLRHAVLAVTTPRLFGVSDDALVLSRAWAPLVGGAVVAGTCASAGAAARGDAWGPALAMTVLVVGILTVVRLDAAAKGFPPLWLTAPVVTPMGDMSVVGTVVWQIDAVLAAALVGTGALALWSGSTLGTVVLVLVVAVSLIQWRMRLRRL